MTNRRFSIRSRGFMFLDAVVGLMLITAAASLLAVASVHAIRAEDRLAENRRAVRAAERVLVAIEAGAALPPADADTRIVVEKVEGQSGPRVWVRVEAESHGRHATLYGLTSAEAAEAAGKAYPAGGKS